MAATDATLAHLAEIPNLTVSSQAPLSRYTRFAIGGPADIYAETTDEAAFIRALGVAEHSGLPVMVIGGGTNLIVSDDGFRGVVLRYRAELLTADGVNVHADAGADLQELIDFTIAHGL